MYILRDTRYSKKSLGGYLNLHEISNVKQKGTKYNVGDVVFYNFYNFFFDKKNSQNNIFIFFNLLAY